MTPPTLDASGKALDTGQVVDLLEKAPAARKKLDRLDYITPLPVHPDTPSSTSTDAPAVAGSSAARTLQERTYGFESEQVALRPPPTDKKLASRVRDADQQVKARQAVSGEDDVESVDSVAQDLSAAIASNEFRAGEGTGDTRLPAALRAMLAQRAAKMVENERVDETRDRAGVDRAVASDGRLARGREISGARRGMATPPTPTLSPPFARLSVGGEEHPGRALVLQAQGATLLIDERGPVMMSAGESVCFAMRPANAGEPAGSTPDDRAPGSDGMARQFAGLPLPTALRADLDALFTRAGALAASSRDADRLEASSGIPADGSEATGAGRTLWLQQEDRSAVLLGQDADAAGAQTIDEFSRQIQDLLETHYTMDAACAELRPPR